METEAQTDLQPNPQPIQKRFQLPSHILHLRPALRQPLSPAARTYCHYHLSTRRPIQNPASQTPLEPFALPVLEDRASIQPRHLPGLLARIASNELDPKRARLLIFGLQIAIRALPRVSHTDNPQRTRGERARDENAAYDLQDQMELDPSLGLLAPLAEFVPP